jgi:hypothetical protein
MKIGFLYEHPTWSEALVACFKKNGVDILPMPMGNAFDTGNPMGLGGVINRVNIMPSVGANPNIVFHTLHYLNWLEIGGVRVVNGAKAHYVGASKAAQNGIFYRLNLRFPNAIAISHPQDALAAAERIGFPLIVKPNIGGSGSHVAKYETYESLQAAVDAQNIHLGIDGTGLVQEYIESDGYVYRIEILGDQFFYAIRQPIKENQFNYCAADGCHVGDAPASASPVSSSDVHSPATFEFCVVDSKKNIERIEPAQHIIQQVMAIIKMAGADVGGVEYLIDQKTGQPCFYDFNSYSNFVSNGKALLGFAPEQRYVDFIKRFYQL